MHQILKRQLEHAFGSLDNVPKDWQDFLKAVSDTYQHFDEDRELLDRSLSISSKEFAENSQKLKEAKEKVEEIVKARTSELAEEKSRLMSSIDSLSVGFGIFNADGSIFKLNAIFKKTFNLNAAKTILDIEQQIKCEVKCNLMFKEAIEQKQVKIFNASIQEKTYLKIVISPILLEGTGQTIGAVVLAEDITKEQEVEKAKTEFIILASHQLRTPLTVIKWNNNLLNKKIKPMPEMAKEEGYIKAIEDGCNRMSELIEDLLNVTRIESGKLTVKLEPFNFISLCKLTIEEQKHLLDKKDLKLEEAYELSSPEITLDKNLLKIIIQNLLSNSIKYTPNQGNIKIEAKVEKNELSNKHSLFFSVTDNGYGIPQEEQSKIFSKMFRADNIKLINVSGTGLGLYITKSIVTQLGGEIWFTSETTDGQMGTTFFVRLPIDTVSKN